MADGIMACFLHTVSNLSTGTQYQSIVEKRLVKAFLRFINFYALVLR